MKNQNDNDFLLSHDSEENTRMENQLLGLKIKAELGADTFIREGVPAHVENEFLKNILEFENSYSESEETKICDLLDNPQVKPEIELDDLQVKHCLNELIALMLTKHIAVDFTGDYDNRIKYKFITEELFEESIRHIGISGMIMHFIYEEFHPDHKTDLENKAKKFISAWFEKSADDLLWGLADPQILLPDGSVYTKENIKENLRINFERYSQFSDCKYVIAEIHYELSQETGKGWAEGTVSYNAIIENCEAVSFQGSFKIYFSLEYGWWEICYFDFPGFNFFQFQ